MGLTIGLEYTPDLMEFPTADRVLSSSATDAGGAIGTAVTGEDSGTQTIKASVEEISNADVGALVFTPILPKIIKLLSTTVSPETLSVPAIVVFPLISVLLSIFHVLFVV